MNNVDEFIIYELIVDNLDDLDNLHEPRGAPNLEIALCPYKWFFAKDHYNNGPGPSGYIYI